MTETRGDRSAWLVTGVGVVATLAVVDVFGLSHGVDLAMLAVAIGGIVAGLALARDADSRVSRVLISAVVFVTWVLASALASGTVWSGLFGVVGSSLGFIQIAALVSVGGSARARRHGVREALSQLAPWVVLLQAVSVLVQVALGRHGTGTLSNTTSMSQVLLLLLPLVVFSPYPAVSKGAPRRPEMWRWAIVAVALVALGASGARLGLMLGLVEVTALVAWEWRSSGRPATPMLAAIGIVLAASVVLGLPRLSRAVLDPSGAFHSRSQMWSVAVELIGEEPLFGYGADAFRTAAAPIAPVSLFEREGRGLNFSMLPSDPHDVVLAVLVGFGAVGLVMLGWLALEILREWWRGRLRPPPMRPFALGVLAYCASGLLAPLTLQTLVLFVVVLGASLGGEDAEADGLPLPRGARIVSGALVVLVSAGLLAHGATRLAIGSQSSLTAGDAVRTEGAADLWRYDPFLYYMASWRLVSVGGSDPAARDPEAVRRTIVRATELEPSNPFYALDRARVAAMLGDPEEEVLEAYDTALSLFPNSHEANADLAGYLVSIGRAEEAVAHVELALTLASTRASTHRRAAEVYQAVGEADLAEEHTLRAQELDPGE
jgi:hypothetical protein